MAGRQDAQRVKIRPSTVGHTKWHNSKRGAGRAPSLAENEEAVPEAAEVTQEPISVRAAIGFFAGQVGGLTALAYYVGYVQTGSTLRYFGVPPSLVEFSTAQYVVRAAGSALSPIMLAGFLTAIFALIHPQLVGALQRKSPFTRRRILGTITWIGLCQAGTAAALAFGVAGYVPNPAVFWLLLAAGLAVSLYGLALRARTYTGRHDSFGPVAQLAVVALILGALFGGLSIYLQERGTKVARAMSLSLESQPYVRVLSESPLGVSGPGITEIKLSGEEEAYQYGYEGLVFLIRSEDRHFLLPREWAPGAPVIVLVEQEGIRFEYYRAPGW